MLRRGALLMMLTACSAGVGEPVGESSSLHAQEGAAPDGATRFHRTQRALTAGAPSPSGSNASAADVGANASPDHAASIVALSGKCVGVEGGAAVDGAAVELLSCDGSASQKWSFVNGEIVGDGGKCLDVVGAENADGAKIQLSPCGQGATQGWSLGDGKMIAPGGRCLDVTGSNDADGTPIQISSCSGADNQEFSFGDAMPQFYGGNAHWDYSWSPQVLADHLHQEGMTVVRMDTDFDIGRYGRVADFATGLAQIDPALHVFAVITADFDETKDEATNYAEAFSGAATVASALGAAGVTDFECGNEMTTDPRVFPTAGLAGDDPSQYQGGPAWSALRGTLRGMVDGVKSVNASYRTAVNFTIAQVAASDMLWNGDDPDGSSGHPTLRWDLTSWHNYEVYGSLFGMGTQAHGSQFNLIEYVANAYQRPIVITEWNANPERTDAEKTVFTQNWLSLAYAQRARYRIESTMIYQLDGGPADFGLFAFPSQTATFSAFAAANKAL